MLTVHRKSLLDALRRAKRTTDKRASLPILACVGLEYDAESGTLLVHATDLERHALYHVPAETDGGDFAPVAIPVDRLLKIARAAKAGSVELDTDAEAHALTLHAGRARFRLLGHSVDDMPAFPVCAECQSYAEIPADALRAALERVAPAMSTDDTRYHLNSVCLGHEGARSVLTATDGHRMMVTRGDFTLPVRPKGDSLIPRLGVLDLIDALKGETTARVWADASGLFAQAGDTLLAVKWIDAEYPDYGPVLDGARKGGALILPRAELIEAAGRVALIAREHRHGAVTLEVAEGALTLRASHPDMGEAEESIPVGYVGAPIEVAVNAGYLIDSLERLAGDKVSVMVRDSLAAMALLGSDDADTVAVVMPMRL